jgi:hypothetical protein
MDNYPDGSLNNLADRRNGSSAEIRVANGAFQRTRP